MSMMEYALPFVLLLGVSYMRYAIAECLKDDSLSTHLFTELQFTSKTPKEQRIIVDNVSYIASTICFVILILVIPFHNFYYYGVQDLYAFIQVCMLCMYNTSSKRIEKISMACCVLVYIVCKSVVLDVFVIYGMFSIEGLLTVEEQLFNGKLLSARTKRRLKVVDGVLNVAAWVFSLLWFIANPRIFDAAVIPCLFWVQYNMKLQNKKKF